MLSKLDDRALLKRVSVNTVDTYSFKYGHQHTGVGVVVSPWVGDGGADMS